MLQAIGFPSLKSKKKKANNKTKDVITGDGNTEMALHHSGDMKDNKHSEEEVTECLCAEWMGDMKERRNVVQHRCRASTVIDSGSQSAPLTVVLLKSLLSISRTYFHSNAIKLAIKGASIICIRCHFSLMI